MFSIRTEASGGPRLLSTAYEQMRDGSDLTTAVYDLCFGLRAIRDSLPAQDWNGFCVQNRTHPVVGLLHADPYTRWGFEKPRGYPGDARLLDFLYRIPVPERPTDTLTPFARHLMEVTTGGSGAQAIRGRRSTLAHALDQVADEVKMPAVLSVACGHARELELSSAAAGGRIGTFLGLDHDERSLQALATNLEAGFLRTRCMSVRDLLKARECLGSFDFIYSTGLYDYLADRAAARLTAILFSMLKHGGRLLIANAMPSIAEIGYMDFVMDWKLIYRKPEALESFAAEIDASEISEKYIHRENSDAFAYMELHRC